MKQKKHDSVNLRRMLRSNLFSLGFIWRHSKLYLLCALANMLLDGFSSPVTLLLTSRLFDLLDQGTHFLAALQCVLWIAAWKLFGISWDCFYDTCSSVLQARLEQRIQGSLLEKARTLDLAQYDDPDYYHNFIFSMRNAHGNIISAVRNLTDLGSLLFAIAATMGVIAHIDIWAMAATAASCLFSFWLGKKNSVLSFAKSKSMLAVTQKDEYIDRVHRLADHAKELRLTRLGECLTAEYDRNQADYETVTKQYGKKLLKLDIAEGINDRCIYFAVIAWIVYRMAVLGKGLLGGLTIAVNANWRLRQTMQRFGSLLAVLPKQTLQVEQMLTFLAAKPKLQGGTEAVGRFEQIELRNVCFGYRADQPVLHDVSMTIRRGEKIAVVGYNGAGKTTLISLLLRLYDADSGAILYNGTDIRNLRMDSYRRNIGAAFQDHRLFAATVGENIVGDEYREADSDRCLAALAQAALSERTAAMPQGLQTMLTREFDADGVILSGGEAQKLAIARVFASDAELYVLDEPSAALDPLAEYHLHNRIQQSAQDKTVIFISHRLSTTRLADRIYMMENGRIIEAGNHAELMALSGKYAAMFHAQAEAYVQGIENGGADAELLFCSGIA
ncbi:MAG: ABC transporter ATP-binding protein [Ruminococcaceae bacterium]|nr:ABC transporter ATP-binding protein [Oscillospiraceae bacterium]